MSEFSGGFYEKGGENLRNVVLFRNLFWSTGRKNWSSDQENLLEIQGCPKFNLIFVILDQFICTINSFETEYNFLNLFLEVPVRSNGSGSNALELLKCQLEGTIGI